MLGVTSAAKAEIYPEVRNLEPLTAMENMEMIVEGPNVERLAYAAELITALQGEGLLGSVAWIDVKDSSNPSFYYGGRLTVYFGSLEDTPRKAALFRDALTKLTEDDSGTLRFNGGSDWIFSPD